MCRTVRVQEEFSLGELAVRFGSGAARRSPEIRVSHVATLSQAGAGTLELPRELALPQADVERRGRAPSCSRRRMRDGCPVAALDRSESRILTYARIATLLHPEPRAAPGIHPTAVVVGARPHRGLGHGGSAGGDRGGRRDRRARRRRSGLYRAARGAGSAPTRGWSRGSTCIRGVELGAALSRCTRAR